MAGAIGSVVVAGPLALGLFSTYAAASPAMWGGLVAGGVTGGGIGGGIGAGIKKFIPRKWFGAETALSKAIAALKQSRKRQCYEKFPSGEDTELPSRPSTGPSTSGIQMLPANSCTMSNTASVPPTDTTNRCHQRSSVRSTHADDSHNTETNASTEYLFAPPTDWRRVSAFANTYGQTNYFYGVKVLYNFVRNSINRPFRRSNYFKME